MLTLNVNEYFFRIICLKIQKNYLNCYLALQVQFNKMDGNEDDSEPIIEKFIMRRPLCQSYSINTAVYSGIWRFILKNAVNEMADLVYWGSRFCSFHICRLEGHPTLFTRYFMV